MEGSDYSKAERIHLEPPDEDYDCPECGEPTSGFDEFCDKCSDAAYGDGEQ